MNLPGAEVMYTMESTDWVFSNHVIKEGDYYYIGEVNENKEPNGYGFKLRRDKKVIYENYWVSGRSQGKGMIVTDSFVSFGTFKDGEWKGLVIDEFYDGGKFKGLYENGKRYGLGKFLCSNGDTYKGNWKDDNWNGHGIFGWSNGDFLMENYTNYKQDGTGLE